MSYIVRMPKLGVEMERGIVLEWHVAVDGAVAADDVIAEVESEKTTAEVTAREDGHLRRRYLEEGEEGPPGTPMGLVAAPGEDISALEAEVAAGRDEPGTEETAGEAVTESGPDRNPRTVESPADEPRADAGAGDPAASGVAPRTPDGQLKATPKAKKRARARGVSLTAVSGTGPGGCIVAGDVEAACSAVASRSVRRERELSEMRATIADRLGRSYREAPHVTVDREIDVEAPLATAAAADERADADVAVTDVVLAAVSATLGEHPDFNATFDADGRTHTVYEEHNLAIAVDVDGGLLTPVLPDVRSKPPGAIAAERRRLVDRVRDDDYTAETLSGGTFTVSNLGVFGADSFTPIIDPPQVAILGLGRIRERAVPTDGDVAVRRHGTFSLSFDHRVVDGADAARFLTTLDEHLQDAQSLV